MKLIARVFLLATGLILLGHYLPQGYWLLAEKAQRPPFVFYSCVEKRFLFYRFGGTQGLQMTDTAGRLYTREEFERLLPLDNYLQLLRDGKLPESVEGVALSPERIKRERLSYKLKPVLLDSPVAGLYPLLEADSGRVRLEMPPDFMRLDRRIEFVDSQTNRLNSEKSRRFQAAFDKAGFVFPAHVLGGNPTTLKPFDDGYFLVDARGAAFQLRQVRGEPELRRLSEVASSEDKARWEALRPRFFLVQEQNPEAIRVIIINQDDRVYLAVGRDFHLVEVPLSRFAPASMTLVLRGDLLNRLITVSDDTSLEAVVLDRDYKLVDRYSEDLPQRTESSAGRLARTLFPFAIGFDDANSGFLGLHVQWGNALALGLNLGWLAGLVLWWKWRRRLTWRRLPELAALAVGGLFAVILLVWLPRAE